MTEPDANSPTWYADFYNYYKEKGVDCKNFVQN